MMTAKRSQGRKDTSEIYWFCFPALPRLVLICCTISRYFGRAKDLPGVRELFQSRKTEEEEENQALSFYKKFMNQGPSYYGDLDEVDGKLLEYERTTEEEGMFSDCAMMSYIVDISIFF
jgi:hypothetical protein